VTNIHGIYYFWGFCEQLCRDWKRCGHRKSFSCTRWSRIPHWSKKEQVCNTCSSNLKLFVNVLFSDRGSEIFNAFPLSFPAERLGGRGVEQINKELLWNSEFKQFPDHHSWYSGSNLMPWPKYSFCVFILTKIPILEVFISPFLWYCVDGKLCTTFLWIAVIGGPFSFYSSIINSNSSMHGKGYHFLFRVLTLKGTFLWRWNPDAIVFNSSKHYGTPSYWVQKFFRESSGATLLDAKLQTNSSTVVASAITWQNSNLPENKGMLIPA